MPAISNRAFSYWNVHRQMRNTPVCTDSTNWGALSAVQGLIMPMGGICMRSHQRCRLPLHQDRRILLSDYAMLAAWAVADNWSQKVAQDFVPHILSLHMQILFTQLRQKSYRNTFIFILQNAHLQRVRLCSDRISFRNTFPQCIMFCDILPANEIYAFISTDIVCRDLFAFEDVHGSSGHMR